MTIIYDTYFNTRIELNNLKNRMNLILKYEQEYRQEKAKLRKIIEIQEKQLFQIEQDLSKMTGIQNRLYYEIVMNGLKITKAIEKIAEEEQMDISTIWKNYYPEVKEKINLLSNDINNKKNNEEEKKCKK